VSGWESTGGAGGVTARYDDMESLAGLYSQAAGTVAEVAVDVAGVALSGTLLDSAILSPGSYAEVMGLLAELGFGRSGLAASGLELEALSLRLSEAVLAYRLVDKAMSELVTEGEYLGGFALGFSLPLIALPAGSLVLSVEAARDLPGFVDDLLSGRADLSSFPSRVLSSTSADATAFLLAHPGAAQTLIGGSAGLETGMEAWVPLPLRGMLPFGGVPRDYPEALQSLAGFFRDGTPVVGPGGSQQVGDNVAPTSVSDLFGGVDSRQNRAGGAVSGEIGVERLVAPGGTVRYVVQLPGTESWAVNPGTTARDLATNLHTMAGGSTVYMRGIEQAMAQANIPADAPVMLVGHSQGGMSAAALAAEPEFRQRFNVTQVVTAGAPIARFDVPSGVQVLAVENSHDLVPQLDGAANPDRANVTTMTFNADAGSVGLNHSLGDTYQVAARSLPDANDPSYDAWRATAQGFLDPGNAATTSTYAITRGPGP
jgi:pimeloyl-ACP methyl ester carboxylesterase